MNSVKSYIICAIVAIACQASHAASQVVPEGMRVAYTYTGNDLVYAYSFGGREGYTNLSPAQAPGVRFQLLFDDYLPEGEVFRYITGTPYVLEAHIALAVDTSGNISAWDVSAARNEGSYQVFRSFSVFDKVADYTERFNPSFSGETVTFNLGNPGRWTISLVPSFGEPPAYLVTPKWIGDGRGWTISMLVPEPEAYAMTLIGLLMVGGMAKRRAPRTGQL